MRFITPLGLIILFSANGLSQSQRSTDTAPCSVDARWLNTSGTADHRRSSELPEQLTLLVHLGEGSNCSSAEITVTATYLTEAQDFICSGTIRSAMQVSSQVQVFNISIR